MRANILSLGSGTTSTPCLDSAKTQVSDESGSRVKVWPEFAACAPWRAPTSAAADGGRRRSAAAKPSGAVAAEAARDALSMWWEEVKSLVETTAYGVRGAANDVIDSDIVEEASDFASGMYDELEDGIAKGAKASQDRIAEMRQEARELLAKLEAADLSSIGSSITAGPLRELEELYALLVDVEEEPSATETEINTDRTEDASS
ncbi:conserved hypothetical protein [Neospora caninum Liverpool]|uniref:Uncharacterized protein n=1 Tax=Neospora caninum (strain Liverpool) TaxID=572307 RepID=F0VJR3_NEOCL|nr:conserved hypothetical protein [Neospora caninum Liverpool]CBZ53974.1 conserved hypothetical protein [Neospora caninum Liverpool]|eukprot:XP_003884006.1 conserved hypothetical protein [Neospora caninum Liverpool]